MLKNYQFFNMFIFKENHAKLVRELRNEFDKHGLILTAAVAAAEFSMSKSYNIPEISKYLDFINVMTYDLHGAWDKAVGHNTPLYPSSKDVTDLQKQLNVVRKTLIIFTTHIL